MAIRVCVAGVTGWTGSAVARAILRSSELQLVAGIARRASGGDLGETLGGARSGVPVSGDLDEALNARPEVVVDFTKPDSVKERTLRALERGCRVVIGTSGLAAADYTDIERAASSRNLGVIAAGNFSITAALAKRFALLAAEHLPSWEIIDYAHADKVDAPSGTTRELAEELATVRRCRVERPVETTQGLRDAHGATVAGSQIHSVRLPGYVIAFETVFGLPDERLTIRHDAGAGAEPYVAGTLLAIQRVVGTRGLIRGLDRLLFPGDPPRGAPVARD
jgi:4-hydroxy-tetrahydrodipicolinate reductase